jgi:hypothetical protein
LFFLILSHAYQSQTTDLPPCSFLQSKPSFSNVITHGGGAMSALLSAPPFAPIAGGGLVVVFAAVFVLVRHVPHFR